MATAIRIENLSKLYRLGEVGTGTISHDLNRWWARVRGKDDPYAIVGQENRRDQAAKSDYAWALRDINLEVEQGEVLGIIGANGAGKSTLLKLISRITSPTSGFIRAKGRIASLLEVGTGMHPEMTARENIYLNGAILGMKRHEITRKFDEIIDFAGCRMYVDTPVKRYSSGMRVRLGFAVAAFLEPEILIVDEVLAVGDADFQRRAIGKMQDVSRESGRTIIFVSHNLGSVKTLCQRGVVLDAGKVFCDAVVEDAASAYIRRVQSAPASGRNLLTRTNRTGSGRVLVAEFWTENGNGERAQEIEVGDPIVLAFRFVIPDPAATIENVNVGFSIHDPQDRSPLLVLYSSVQQELFSTRADFIVRCRIEELPLVDGSFPVGVRVLVGGVEADWPRDFVGFVELAPGDFYRNGEVVQNGKGRMLVRGQWECEVLRC